MAIVDESAEFRPGVPRATAIVVALTSGSHVINHMYLVLFPPILAILALEFDVSLAALGVAMGVQAFVNTGCQLPYGYLADNYDRTISLGTCLVLGSIGVLVVAGAPSFAWVLVGQAIIGLGVAGHHPAHFSLLADATPERLRGRAFSVHGFAGNVGFAIPPVLIVSVIAVPGLTWRSAFAIIGGVGLAFAIPALVVLDRFVDSEVTSPNETTREGDDSHALVDRVGVELRALRTSPAILSLGLLALVGSTAFWGLNTYLVILLTEGYGLGLERANYALSALFVVGAVFVLLGGVLSDRYRPGPLIAGSYLLVAASILVLASFVVPPLVAAAVAIVGGSLGGLSMPARDKLVDAFSARGDIGRNFAILTIGIMLGNTIAPPVFGVLIDGPGLRVTFVAVAALAFAGVVLTVGIVRTFDRRETEPAAVGADDQVVR